MKEKSLSRSRQIKEINIGGKNSTLLVLEVLNLFLVS